MQPDSKATQQNLVDLKPELSVVLCTYNPAPSLIARALRALARQSLDPARFELIVVDNNSTPPLNEAWLSRLAMRPVRVVREMRQGLTFARVGGINAARADLICFVDDDNELAADYLANVLSISTAEPKLGVWGGICEGRLECPVGRFKRIWLPHLGVRDLGPKPLTGSGRAWGPHEPIGAGICVRRPVAEGYVTFVESGEAAGALGRKGKALLSGEDSLLSRIAHILGLEVGYRPQLRLGHHITAGRLKLRYLARLMNGHGRSYVALARIQGERFDPPPPLGRKVLVKNFLHRCRTEGAGHALGMLFWDRGYQAAILEGLGQPPTPALRQVISGKQ